ncbi:serine/arginine-rich SC35-like splicing factor SCL30A [Tanacetum coccineum]|uniref:Serine/arginine-rich SC35-like splicing factor SCL30A n=1 Tax=Tanacetum coccineum TaxID=301880 RepID=A0ABQ5IZF3_9ASTR
MLYTCFPFSNPREPRGFGFVQFLEPANAAEAKYQMDGQLSDALNILLDAEAARFNDRRSPPPRYSRSPPPRYSQSPPPRYARSRSNSREYSPPPKRKQHVRSVSPGEKRRSRERLYSRSPPPARGRSPPPRSPVVDNRSPPYNGPRSPSPLPPRERSRISVISKVYFGAGHLKSLLDPPILWSSSKRSLVQSWLLAMAMAVGQLGDALSVGSRGWASEKEMSFTLCLVMPRIRASMFEGWVPLDIGRVFVGENIAREDGFSMVAIPKSH